MTTASPAPSTTPVDPDRALHALLEQADLLGRRCDLKAMVANGTLRYLACGDAGLWIARVSARGTFLPIERRELDGAATGLFERDGYIWVEVSSTQARRVAASVEAALPAPPAAKPAAAPQAIAAANVRTLAAATPAQPPPPPQAPSTIAARAQTKIPTVTLVARTLGRVVAVEPGVVIINLGRRNAVDDADHIAFYQDVSEDLGADQHAVHREGLAVGRVISVAPERARVALGLNERVPLGAVAVLTGAPLTAASLAPPRAAGLWELAFVARPFMVLENLGAGVFVDARAGYRSPGGLHLEAMLEPFAVASAREGATVPFAAVGFASYDTRLFEVGLGLGGQTLHAASFDLQPGTGLTLAQRLRLGARDGLMLEVISYVALFHSDFKFSSLRLQGQIPLSDAAWLLLAGGGGSLGLGFGEIGLRLLLVGNGDRGSFFLRTVVGGVNVFKERPCFNDFSNNVTTVCPSSIDYGGPMVGAGGEWRL